MDFIHTFVFIYKYTHSHTHTHIYMYITIYKNTQNFVNKKEGQLSNNLLGYIHICCVWFAFTS